MCCCFAQLLLLVLRSEYASDAQARGVVSGVQQAVELSTSKITSHELPSVLWDPRCGGAPRNDAPPGTAARNCVCAKYFVRERIGGSDP
jgi:hypothetical protein